MKTRVTFEYLLPGTAREISLYFSDFHLFGKHHPYMVQVIDLKNTSAQINTYQVYEKVKLWGLIPMKPAYKVDVSIPEPEKHILYQSEVHKGVFLEVNYTFIQDPVTHTVKIKEAMMIKGYPIINPIFVRLLKKSRKLFIESIRKDMENILLK